MELNGLILCGGQSSRLGFDKLKILKNEMFIYEWWRDQLKNYCHEVRISCNDNQKISYNIKNAIIDESTHQGPMGGIYSMIKNIPNTAIFAIACDLCYIEKETIALLVANRNTKKEATVIIQKNSQHIFPLFSILETSIFPKIINEYKNHQKSLIQVLKHSNLEILESDANFNGINTQKDYQAYLLAQQNSKFCN